MLSSSALSLAYSSSVTATCYNFKRTVVSPHYDQGRTQRNQQPISRPVLSISSGQVECLAVLNREPEPLFEHADTGVAREHDLVEARVRSREGVSRQVNPLCNVERRVEPIQRHSGCTRYEAQKGSFAHRAELVEHLPEPRHQEAVVAQISLKDIQEEEKEEEEKREREEKRR